MCKIRLVFEWASARRTKVNMCAVQLRALPGFGERKVANLLRAIELSRNGSAALLLWALGVPHVGSEMAPVLIKHFGSLAVRHAAKLASALWRTLRSLRRISLPKDLICKNIDTFLPAQALEAADETALATIDGIAEKTAAAIQQWFRVPSNARLAQSLAEVWNVAQPAAAAEAPIAKAASGSDVGSSSAGWSLDLGVIKLQSGQKIVFTGKLGDTDRTMLKDWCGPSCMYRCMCPPGQVMLTRSLGVSADPSLMLQHAACLHRVLQLSVTPSSRCTVQRHKTYSQLPQQSSRALLCRARAHGLQLSGSVTKTTDCLVAADGPQGATGVPTGKYRAAQANGTPIVEDRSTLAELNEAISEWAASTGV